MSLRDLEAELVGEKHWALRGEVTATDRPLESLLEEGAIEFKLSNRTDTHDETVQVDEETGESKNVDFEGLLTSIIKKRIGLRQWDDVRLREIVAPAVEEKKELKEVLEEAEKTTVKKSLVEEYTGMSVTKTGAVVNILDLEREAEELWKKLNAKLDQYCLA